MKFYSFLFVSVGCQLRLYELQMTTTRKKSNKYGNWRVGKHFTAGLCDYWNWFHSPGFWLKTKFYIVLMTKIFCSIYWKFSKLFDALKCQLFKHSKKKSNRWYKAVIIILPVLSPPLPQKYPWFEETRAVMYLLLATGNSNCTSNILISPNFLGTNRCLPNQMILRFAETYKGIIM